MKFITRIPTHLNDGSPVVREVVEAIEAKLVARFGGFTTEAPSHGAWADASGRVYAETAYTVSVACSRDDYADAKALVIEIGRMLEQEAMYFEVQYFDGIEIIDL